MKQQVWCCLQASCLRSLGGHACILYYQTSWNVNCGDYSIYLIPTEEQSGLNVCTGTNQTFSVHHVTDVFLEVVLQQSIEVEITIDRVWAECGWARHNTAVCKQIFVNGILGYIALSFSVFHPQGNSTVMLEEACGMNRKMVYYSYFHSIMNYGLVFWGDYSYCVGVFRLQKVIVRITVGCRSRDTYRSQF